MLRFLNGNLFKFVISLLMVSIIGIGGWIFAEVTQAPSTYVTKSHHETDKTELKAELYRSSESINRQLKSFKEDVTRQQGKLEEKIDKITDILLKRDGYNRDKK